MVESYLQAAKAVADATRASVPSHLLQVSGRALYSPASTLSGRSQFYFLGANPGESADTQLHAVITVGTDLDRLERNRIFEHGYLDERWKGYPSGQAPIQQRGQELFSILAEGDLQAGKALLRETPTSNFVLQRSTSVETLEQKSSQSAVSLARQYWPFHQAVIGATRARVVVTHAVTIARGVARSFRLGEGHQRPSGWGGTLGTCYAWSFAEGLMLLAVPNLSRYIPDGPRRAALSAFFAEFIPRDVPRCAR